MTLIVSVDAFASKAKLKQALDKGVYVHEPSIMGSWTRFSTELPVGFSDTVTNGDKRSKFAKMTRTPAGWEVK